MTNCIKNKANRASYLASKVFMFTCQKAMNKLLNGISDNCTSPTKNTQALLALAVSS